MIEKGKISALQMAILIHPTVSATAILLVPAITSIHGGRDMWISPIWASLVGFLTVYICYRLHRLYPKETVIEYSCHILGRIPGKVIGLFLLLFYLHINGIVLREYSEFIIGNVLPLTPPVVVMGSMTLACAFAVRGGVEVLGRLGQLFIPMVVLFAVVIFLLLIPDMEVKQIRPIMEDGPFPSLWGALTPQSWFSEFFLLSFLFPFLKDREKGLRWGMLAVFLVMTFLLVINLSTIFILGNITSHMVYPVMSIVRYISIADFIEHLESIVMAMWVVGVFLKISVFYYAISLGTANWLQLTDYRPIVLPLGFLLLLIGFWSAPNLQELEQYLQAANSIHMTVVQTLLPLFLLLIATIRKGKSQNKGAKH